MTMRSSQKSLGSCQVHGGSLPKFSFSLKKVDKIKSYHLQQTLEAVFLEVSDSLHTF